MSALRRIRLLIVFDGSAYHGWQAGRSGRGVADVVQGAMVELGVKDDIVSSSRTDSGVHAFGLVAHADLAGRWVERDAGDICDFLNAKLPADIRVWEARWVSQKFHARFDARWKEYRYVVWNDVVMNPLLAGQAWHVVKSLDLAAMKEAANRLIGQHDFHAFTSRRDGELGSPVREIRKLAISSKGKQLTITIRADGFLYKMCRGLVGTLVDVGRGTLDATAVEALLVTDSPRTPGANAPAHGLTLWKVGYRN